VRLEYPTKLAKEKKTWNIQPSCTKRKKTWNFQSSRFNEQLLQGKKRLSLWEKGLGGSPNQVPQGTSFSGKRGLSLKNPCAT
jgi:hypothetical protein